LGGLGGRWGGPIDAKVLQHTATSRVRVSQQAPLTAPPNLTPPPSCTLQADVLLGAPLLTDASSPAGTTRFFGALANVLLDDDAATRFAASSPDHFARLATLLWSAADGDAPPTLATALLWAVANDAYNDASAARLGELTGVAEALVGLLRRVVAAPASDGLAGGDRTGGGEGDAGERVARCWGTCRGKGGKVEHGAADGCYGADGAGDVNTHESANDTEWCSEIDQRSSLCEALASCIANLTHASAQNRALFALAGVARALAQLLRDPIALRPRVLAALSCAIANIAKADVACTALLRAGVDVALASVAARTFGSPDTTNAPTASAAASPDQGVSAPGSGAINESRPASIDDAAYAAATGYRGPWEAWAADGTAKHYCRALAWLTAPRGEGDATSRGTVTAASPRKGWWGRVLSGLPITLSGGEADATNAREGSLDSSDTDRTGGGLTRPEVLRALVAMLGSPLVTGVRPPATTAADKGDGDSAEGCGGANSTTDARGNENAVTTNPGGTGCGNTINVEASTGDYDDTCTGARTAAGSDHNFGKSHRTTTSTNAVVRGCAAVAKWLCRALAHIASSSVAACARLGSAGVASPLISLLVRTGLTPACPEPAAAALALTLALARACPANRARLGVAGIVEPLVALLQAPTLAPRDPTAAVLCAAVVCLALEPANCARFMAARVEAAGLVPLCYVEGGAAAPPPGGKGAGAGDADDSAVCLLGTVRECAAVLGALQRVRAKLTDEENEARDDGSNCWRLRPR